MATLELTGFDDLEDAFRRISEIPFDVTAEALDAMAAVAAEKIRSTGESMGVRDPESDVHILDRIKPRKPKKTTEGGYEMISFTGTRRRGNTTTRNAEIAFVNEYGKKGQPARPFIGTAMNRNADQIQDQAEKVIGDWIENEFNQ
ncbi:MAG: hypothetical protein IIY43_02855 [Oscillospiraceae bacterium]|nr:hypothetical protein [Oscillospiraceae bacterium]